LSTDISKLVPEEVQVSPQKGKKLAIYINRLGLCLALWEALYSHPYSIALTVAMIFPLVTLFVLYIHRKSISLEDGDKKTGTKQPSLLAALIASSMILALRAGLDYDLLVFSDCLIAWGIGFIVLTTIILWIESTSAIKIRFFSGHGLSIMIFVLAYSYGSMIIADCFFDNTKPEIYHTHVLRKHMTGGRRYNFYLMLDKRGQQTKPGDVSVSSSFYRKTQPGDGIDVYVKKGTLDIPWYFVAK
jgi:hypothetical protein